MHDAKRSSRRRLSPVQSENVLGHLRRVPSICAFVAHMRNTSRWYRLRGLLEVGFAVFCVLLFFGLFFLSSRGPILVLPGILLIVAYWLAADGAWRFRHGCAIKQFE
jgi:hypothetical protein